MRRGLVLSLDGPSVRVGVSSCPSMSCPGVSGSRPVTQWAIRAGRSLVLSLDESSVCVGGSFCPSASHPCGSGSRPVTRQVIRVRRGLVFFSAKASPRVEVLPFLLRWHPLEYKFTCYWLGDIRIILADSFGWLMDIDSM